MFRIRVQNSTRNGSVDIWNAHMVYGAKFTDNDIPISVRTCHLLPRRLIGFDEAKSIYKKNIQKDPNFYINAFIHFFIDDHKFDGKRSSVWLNPESLLKIAKHFAGVISPDFSTYQDFPLPLKMYNIYRMRSFDFWLEQEDIVCIYNVRWGTVETWKYCFDGIPKNSVVAIGTVASDLRNGDSKLLFENGFRKMIEVLAPTDIVIYGSRNNAVITEAKQSGINVVSFPSKTSLAFEEASNRE